MSLTAFFIVLGLIILAFVLGYVVSNWVRNHRGKIILVPTNTQEHEFQKYFPDLVGDKLRLLTPNPSKNFNPADRTSYEQHLTAKFGNKDCEAAGLSVLVRDRTKSPALLPVDVKLETELLAIYKSPDKPDEEKEALAEAVRGRLQNIPDLYDRTTIYTVEEGKKKFHYFPRIQLEFTSRLQSPSQLDSFFYLGMVIVIRGMPGVRFVDYQPKVADILEFTRGQLTLNNQFQAKSAPSFEQGMSEKATGMNEATVGNAGKKTTSFENADTRNISLSPELSFTLSENYLNDLKESIEARTSGILENGKVFFADFRAIKEKRIGGTYSFDIMMEIPSEIVDYDGETYSSCPIVNEVQADAYLVGVVRHVAERGYTGIFTQVPQPENDIVFHQVIARYEPCVKLWTFSGEPWGGETMSAPSCEFLVKVITNRKEAVFIIRNVDDDQILGQGSGNQAEVKVFPEKTVKAQVEFLDIVICEQGRSFVLKAPPSEKFTIQADQNGGQTVLGNYQNKKH